MRGSVRAKRASLFWTAALAWAALMFFFSLQNAVDSQAVSLSLSGFMLKLFPFLADSPEMLDGFLRKAAHFCVFAVEGFLIAAASMDTFAPKTACSVSAFICMVMAGANEYSETFAADRSCEVRDMLIDFGGAVLGILIAVNLRAYTRKERKN